MPSNDIVARLRQIPTAWPLVREAADEIERLQRELAHPKKADIVTWLHQLDRDLDGDEDGVVDFSRVIEAADEIMRLRRLNEMPNTQGDTIAKEGTDECK